MNMNYVIMSEGVLEQVRKLHALARENKQLNEQWFLDFQDELNKLSVEV